MGILFHHMTPIVVTPGLTWRPDTMVLPALGANRAELLDGQADGCHAGDERGRIMLTHQLVNGLARVIRTVLFLAPVVWSCESFAQEAKPGPGDEKAIAILQGMSNYLAKEATISFRARTFLDVVQKTGIKVKMAREVELSLKKPNGLQAELRDETGAAGSVWYDGSKLIVWRRSENEVMNLQFTGGIDKLLDELTDKYEFQIPIADLLYSDVAKALGENLISSEYVGPGVVDGVPCHHLSFESEGADWQIWIEADSTPVPRRFVIDYVTEQNQPQFMAQFDAWSIGADLDDSQFTVQIPESVKRVDFGKAQP